MEKQAKTKPFSSAAALAMARAAQLGAGPDDPGLAKAGAELEKRTLAELAKAGFDPVFGARPLKRAIQQRIENPVDKLILEGRFGPKDVIPVDVEGGEFRFGRVVH